MARFARCGPRTTTLILAAALVWLAAGCSVVRRGPAGAAPSPAGPAAQDVPPPPLPVEKAPEDVIVAAWAEPSRLPPPHAATLQSIWRIGIACRHLPKIRPFLELGERRVGTRTSRLEFVRTSLLGHRYQNVREVVFVYLFGLCLLCAQKTLYLRVCHRDAAFYFTFA